MCARGLSVPSPSTCWLMQVSGRSASLCQVSSAVSPPSAGIMLGRMGDSGAPLVSFCQCLNESVMKIVAVAVW